MMYSNDLNQKLNILKELMKEKKLLTKVIIEIFEEKIKKIEDLEIEENSTRNSYQMIQKLFNETDNDLRQLLYELEKIK